MRPELTLFNVRRSHTADVHTLECSGRKTTIFWSCSMDTPTDVRAPPISLWGLLPHGSDNTCFVSHQAPFSSTKQFVAVEIVIVIVVDVTCSLNNCGICKAESQLHARRGAEESKTCPRWGGKYCRRKGMNHGHKEYCVILLLFDPGWCANGVVGNR